MPLFTRLHVPRTPKWLKIVLGVLAVLVRRGWPVLAAAFVAVLLVAIQTDAYGIPWLAYCVWWLAGSGLAEQARAVRKVSA